ncbi:MAG: hypothetical protein ABJA98_29960 [Acidobacteriota bacterium]
MPTSGCRPLPLRRLGCACLFGGLASATLAAQQAKPVEVRDAGTLTLSALTAADENGSTNETEDVRDPQYRGRRVYSALSAAVEVAPQHERFNWQVNASTGVRYYGSLHEVLPSGQSAGGSLSFMLGGRTTIAARETATYSPTYSLVPLLPVLSSDPGRALADLDYGVVRSPNYTNLTNISITQALTSRASVTVGYGINNVRFTSPDEPDLKGSNAQAILAYRLTKYATFHAGYRRRLGQYDFTTLVPDAVIEDYDLGVDYNKVLSLKRSRKTTLNFATGSSIYKDFDGRHYMATGSATLDHRVSRTGHLGLVYSRGVRLLEGLLAPLFTDSLTATAGSSLSSRLRVSSAIGYVYGTVGNSPGGNSYGSWNGAGQFFVGFTRRSSFHVGYNYYRHDVGSAVQLLGRLPNHDRRHTLYAGVMFGLPLVHERVRQRS